MLSGRAKHVMASPAMANPPSLELHWLPPHADARAALAAAKAMRPAEALSAIGAIANHRLDYLATLTVDRALTATMAAAPDAWPEVRLALLGSTSTEHLLPAIRVAGARHRLRITPFSGGFSQFRQELLLPNSEVRRFAPNVVLLALTRTDTVQPPPLGATRTEVADAVAAAIAAITELWRVVRNDLGASVIQQTFLHTDYPLFGNLDGAIPASPRALTDALNQALREAASREGVALLDLDHWAQAHGRDAWFDAVRWHHAKQQIAPTAAVFYGDLVARLIAAMRGQSKKCLVLDLDNTLWGGVIGDDGLDGIVLGQGSAAGEAFLAFQHYAKLLSRRGVILAVCSKNDLPVAESVFRDHPDMALRRDDFAAFVANWQDKAANLRDIAAALNIGADSLVFFDDNPAERDIVRRTLAEVAVPEVPPESSGYIRCLAEAGYFEAIAFTADDRSRAEQYRANAERDRIAASATDIPAFLASLEMRMVVAPFTKVDLPRIAQLTGKTNQFNLTTRRHAQETLAAFAADPRAITISFRLLDKFGDNGLISVLVALSDSADPATYRIDTWLMSCRVLGRQVEEEIINQLCRAASARSARTIVGEYIPTPRNGMVADLYPRLGFTALSAGADGSLWSLDVATRAPTATAIEIDDHTQLQAAE